MGQDVKTYVFPSLGALGLASSVRPRWSEELVCTSPSQKHPRYSRADPWASGFQVISHQRYNGIPVDIKALSFSAQKQEPSFYRGLSGPSLYSALQGGIAYHWGLWTCDPGPEIQWMLSPVTISSPGTSPL